MTGRIAVTVPSTELGYVLAQRIGSGAEVVSDGDGDGNGKRWLVVLDEISSNELIALLSVVECWLRDEMLAGADVHVDGRSYRMECA
jgi:hypothetical protein